MSLREYSNDEIKANFKKIKNENIADIDVKLNLNYIQLLKDLNELGFRDIIKNNV